MAACRGHCVAMWPLGCLGAATVVSPEPLEKMMWRLAVGEVMWRRLALGEVMWRLAVGGVETCGSTVKLVETRSSSARQMCFR